MTRLSNLANAEALQGSMSNVGGGLKLPFAAPTIWWKNGSPELDTDEIKDVRRFGGWGISKEEIDEIKDSIPPELPANWRLFENLRNTENKTYAAYLARSVWAAPIDRRFTWFDNNGKSRSALNILAYLAIMKDHKLVPWGPVVLTGKAYGGKAIDDAFAEFRVATATLRGEDGVNLFYHPLGTFGETPKFEKRVAKQGGASSPITPCQLWKPDGGFTPKTLDEWFVGDEIAAEMGLLRIQAKEWLEDWNGRAKKEAETPLPLPAEDDFPY